MTFFSLPRLAVLIPALLIPSLFLTACGQGQAPMEKAAALPPIEAPSGRYVLDPTHASLHFSLKHLAVSNYVARFTKFAVDLQLDTAQIANSSVSINIDPTSVRTDYAGDYRATHAKSPFPGWDEELAMSPKFLDAGNHPKITYASTAVRENGKGGLTVDGNLTLRGTTLPVSLDVQLVGAAAQHPFTKRGAVGFSAKGSFQRSAFGMDYLVKPGYAGDTITVMFEGEMHQAAAQ